MAALLRPPAAGSSSAYADDGSGIRHPMSMSREDRSGSPPENWGTPWAPGLPSLNGGKLLASGGGRRRDSQVWAKPAGGGGPPGWATQRAPSPTAGARP